MNEDRTTYRWRMLILFVILASLAALIAIAWLEPSPWEGLRSRFPRWEGQTSGPLSRMDLPPRWLSMSGVLLATSLSGILWMYLFPARIRLMAKMFSRPVSQLARLAVLGLAGAALIVTTCFSASFTMSTFPLVVFLGGLLFLAGFTGIVALAYALGKALLQRAAWGHLSPVASLLLGAYLLFALSELPVLGVFFRVFLFCLGSGIVIATRFGTGTSWNLDSMIEG
jgi:hypothetical protein